MITGMGAGTVPGDTVMIPPTRPGVRMDRVVVGLLVGAAGLGWLLDEAGVSVAWRMYPAAALVLVGAALTISLLGGTGRTNLAVLGAVLLVVAVAVGIGVDRFAGPMGDSTVAPAADAWPVTVRRSAGTVKVDLERNPLPASGLADIQVGAGRIVLTVPASAGVRIEAQAIAGDIIVDGVKVTDGVDIDWSEPGTADAVVVRLAVALGEIEVRHG